MVKRVATKAEVAAMQTELKRLGFYGGNIDGAFGPLSVAAVKLAQAHFGLPVTGRLTLDLLVELRVIHAPVKKPGFLTGLVVNAALSKLKGLPAMNILTGYKTYITAILMVLVAGGALIGVHVPGFEGADPGTLLVAAFGLIFSRVGSLKG